MKIVEIEDKRYDKAILTAMNRVDSPRRFEIHFSDIHFSLIRAFHDKLFPSDYTEKDSDSIKRWHRGIGTEIGDVRALRAYFPIHQKITRCGHAVGSVDLVLFGERYEITSTVFPFKSTQLLPMTWKIKQLMYYLASEDVPYGKLRVYFEIRDYKGRLVRTWKVSLTKDQRKHFRNVIRKKSRLLYGALKTGDWTILPRTVYSWDSLRMQENKLVKWMSSHPNAVRNAWKRWLKDGGKYLQ